MLPMSTWIERTMRDVRAGDHIRPIGSNSGGTHISARYLPPDPAGLRNRGSWHVVAGAAGHWDDRVVKPGDVWLCMDGGEPRCLKPDFPVEIEMPQEWLDVAAIFIETGHAADLDDVWANRLDESC